MDFIATQEGRMTRSKCHQQGGDPPTLCLEDIPKKKKVSRPKSRSSIASLCSRTSQARSVVMMANIEMKAEEDIITLKRLVRSKEFELNRESRRLELQTKRRAELEEKICDSTATAEDLDLLKTLSTVKDTQQLLVEDLTEELVILKSQLEEDINVVRKKAEIEKQILQLQEDNIDSDDDRMFQDDMENFVDDWNNNQSNPKQLDLRTDQLLHKQYQDNIELPHPEDEIRRQEDPHCPSWVKTLFVGMAHTHKELVTDLANSQRELVVGLANNQQKNTVIVSKQVMDKDLPLFGGKAEEWPIFRDEFHRTTLKYAFENSDNIQRLRKCLKGSAKKSVTALLDDPCSVNKIMEILELHFGQPDMIISAQVEKVRKLAAPDDRKPETILEFGHTVQNLVARIKSLKNESYLNDITLMGELVKKLPSNMARLWVTWTDNNPERERNLGAFSDWISTETSVVLKYYRPKVVDEKDEKPDKKSQLAPIQSDEKEDKPKPVRTPYCHHCRVEGHATEKCEDFSKLSVEERIEVVKRNNLCFNCLKKNHQTKACYLKRTCGVEGCKIRHHRLLHGSPIYSNRTSENSKENNVQKAEVGSIVGNNNGIRPYVEVEVFGAKGSQKIYALLDSGAEISALDSTVAEAIGVTGIRRPITLVGVGGGIVENGESQQITISISGTFRGAPKTKVHGVQTVDVLSLGLKPQTVDAKKFQEKWNHLRAAPLPSMQQAVPKMIIGSDNWHILQQRQVVRRGDQEPAAFKTRLGWYVTGASRGAKFRSVCCLEATSGSLDEKSHQLMLDFFNQDVMSDDVDKTSPEEQLAITILKSTSRKIDDRWQTGLLWKNDDLHVPDSKAMATMRLRGMEKKMDRDSTFSELVQEKFNDLIKKGYLLPKEEVLKDDQLPMWYLPWFFVYHPSKTPRLVLDAAAKINGKCFNDFVSTGPDLLQSMMAVLTRFRTNNYGLTGDIKEMFPQVKMIQEDLPFQTVLYRGVERTVPPKEYIFTRLIFGSGCSPCSAIYVKDKNADDFLDKYPDSVRAIKQEHYMDDACTGGDTVEEVIQRQREITYIHKEGGFNILKWATNSKDALTRIPEELRAASVKEFGGKSSLPSERTLGLWWNQEEDYLGFNVKEDMLPKGVIAHSTPYEEMEKCRMPTKRELSSIAMRLFDPFGFIAQVRIKALFMMQKCWELNIGWDECLPEQFKEEWIDWTKLLHEVSEVKVSRRLAYNLKKSESVSLHVFVDASHEAYAAVIYLRAQTGGSTSLSFVVGKAKVSPLKKLSIPRMELLAALLGTRLLSSVKQFLEGYVNITDVTYWTDSSTVWYWINGDSSKLKQFVSNRVSEIHQRSTPQQWKWISTKFNPADVATRPTGIKTINPLWISGPYFLLSSPEEWPKHSSLVTPTEKEAELRQVSVLNVRKVLVPLIDVNKSSSWLRLVRTMACVVRFTKVYLNQERYGVTTNDMAEAEIYLLKLSQRNSFVNEHATLCSGKSVSKKNRLNQFSPVLNDQGLIVMQSRIKNADIQLGAKTPIILDPKCHVTSLLITYYHLKNKHFGQESVFNQLRQKYWIIDGRSAVRRIWAKCVICNLRSDKPVQPMMGQIPKIRLTAGETPFTRTGVDYFGPLMVKIGRRREKRYGVIFTCMATRAVHLKLAADLTTDQMILTLMRFINRRGRPLEIISDNGTNFRGAELELRNCLALFDQRTILDTMCVLKIRWTFIPPASPHMGGSYETLIKSVKKILNAQLKEVVPPEYTLMTYLSEVEGILNARCEKTGIYVRYFSI